MEEEQAWPRKGLMVKCAWNHFYLQQTKALRQKLELPSASLWYFKTFLKRFVEVLEDYSLPCCITLLLVLTEPSYRVPKRLSPVLVCWWVRLLWQQPLHLKVRKKARLAPNPRPHAYFTPEREEAPSVSQEMRKPLQFWENAQFGDTRFNERLRSFGPMLRKTTRSCGTRPKRHDSHITSRVCGVCCL